MADKNDTTDEDQRTPDGKPGGGEDSSAADKLPGAPAKDDDSPLGDTDQHSDA